LIQIIHFAAGDERRICSAGGHRRLYAGIDIAMLTLIENTVSVTIRQSDSEPIASAAATASFSLVEATRAERLSKPAARGDRVMVEFPKDTARISRAFR
jgi:type IV secretory pathway protease TraF